jgi:hypothetical protein
MASIRRIRLEQYPEYVTVQSHFHNSRDFGVTDSAKSKVFFSRHSRHFQKSGDIVTLKTTAIMEIAPEHARKNSSHDHVSFFHNACMKGFVKMCQFYVFSPCLQGFQEVTGWKALQTGKHSKTVKGELFP